MKVSAPCLKYRTLAGTWLETERALHRLARSLLQAGEPAAAIESAQRCDASNGSRKPNGNGAKEISPSRALPLREADASGLRRDRRQAGSPFARERGRREFSSGDRQ
jgi:hypothetical protein